MGYAGAAVDAALGIPRPAYAAKRRRGRRGVPSDASGGVELLRVHPRVQTCRATPHLAAVRRMFERARFQAVRVSRA
jgi:hypothetical protein